MDYSNVLQVGIGIVLMIAVGFIVCKFKVIPLTIISTMNKFLFKICFTFLVARALMSKKLSELNFTVLGVCACTSFTTMILLLLLLLIPVKDRFKFYLSTMLPATYVNYVIIGIPIFNSIWGSENNSIAFIIALSNDGVTSPVFLFLSGIYKVYSANRVHREKGEPTEKFSCYMLLQIIMSIIFSPIIIGYIIGFLWSGVQIPIPKCVSTFTTLLGDAILSLSCLCVGGFLAEHSLLSCHWAKFLIAVIVRHILMPAIDIFWCKIFKLSNIESRQIIVMASLPTAVASYLLSANAGVGEGVASTMIFWTNVFFIPVVILWFMVLDKFNLFPEN